MFLMATRKLTDLIPESVYTAQVVQAEFTESNPGSTPEVPVSSPRKPRKSRKLREFDNDMDQALPDFARMLGKVYRGIDELIDSARDESKTLLELKQIEARTRILSSVAKMLPLAQTAEQNHRAKVNDVAIDELSTAQLLELVGVSDAEPESGDSE